MGGGSAGDLVSDRPVAGLILQSTFSSAKALARASFAPGFLVRDAYDNVAAVRAYEGPVLLMHGPGDEVLPFGHAERIAEARDGLDVTPIECGHNDCARVWPEILQRVQAFLGENGILPAP